MRLLIITLSLLISSGCSEGEAARSGERRQTPEVAPSSTPPGVTEDDQTVHLVKGGGRLCETYLLKKVAEDKAEDSRVIRLKAFDGTDKNLAGDVRKWLEYADRDTLGVHELRYGDKRALLLNAISVSATGLAVNFQYWYVKLDEQPIEFMSQSANPDLIFWDKAGLLNYYSVDFSKKFVMEKDWNNITLDLLRYKVDADGKSRLVSEERNVKCE